MNSYLFAAVALVLGGCASAPPQPETPLELDEPPVTLPRGGYLPGDGPPARVPPDIDRLPGAEPRVEAPLPGANKPYTVLGRNYVPLGGDPQFRQRGLATWYGNKYHGRPTASGELYDMYKMTAAHPTLPIPSYARVRHLGNGREVIVRINDRGPFHPDRIVDLSYSAARQLGILEGGSAMVELERLTNESIRTGAWRQGGGGQAATPASSFPVSGGTAPINPRPVPPAAPATGAAAPASAAGFWVQLGAFRQRDGAERFQRQVAAQAAPLAPRLVLWREEPLFKLQAGPYRSRQEALAAADQARSALQLTPMIVQRR